MHHEMSLSLKRQAVAVLFVAVVVVVVVVVVIGTFFTCINVGFCCGQPPSGLAWLPGHGQLPCFPGFGFPGTAAFVGKPLAFSGLFGCVKHSSFAAFARCGLRGTGRQRGPAASGRATPHRSHFFAPLRKQHGRHAGR